MKLRPLWLIALVVCSAVLCPCKVYGQQDFRVEEKTITEIHDAIGSGELTCRKLTEMYLARIKKYDDATGLNAIVLTNSRCLERADQLDRKFQSSGKLLPLHGIAVIAKDNYDTADMQTAAGSAALSGSLPPDDAFQIKALRDAGAVIIGKSNMAEWAYSPLFTISSIDGQTSNPYDLTRVPAGSSGGTAAAVAANFATVGLGTDTGNSIRGPSSHCALAGIRPTIGMTSRDGIVPLFLRNDVGGPMCRTVEDCARVMDVIAGFDPADPITEASKGRVPESFSDLLDAESLAGRRIGVFRTLSNTDTTDPQISRLFDAAIKDIRDLGAEIVDPFDIADLDNRRLQQLQQRLWIDTFRHDIRLYLKSLGPEAPVKSLREIIESKKFDPSVAGRLATAQKVRMPRNARKPYSSDINDDANRKALLKSVLSAMDDAKIDALIYPTWNNPPRKHGDLHSPHGNNSPYISPHTGQPSVTVPMGFTANGLPAGLQWVGRPFSDGELLAFAYAFEQATEHRRAAEKFGPLDN